MHSCIQENILLCSKHCYIATFLPSSARPARAGDLHRYAQPNPLPHSLGHVSHDHLWKGRRPACIIIWHPTCLPKRSAAPPVCPTLPSGWSRQDLDGSDPGGIEMVLGGILLSSWHIPFSRYLYMHAIVLDVSVLVLGQVELLFRREDHMTKFASFFLTRAGPQAKAGWMNPGVCHRTARLCPREGMSQQMYMA